MEQTPLQTSSTSSGPAPKNWLVESILATLLCCFIPGIVAIVFATQVNTKWVNGDLEGSRKASKDAGLWTKISFFLGIAFWVVILLLWVFGIGLGGYFMNRDNGY